MAFVPSQLGYYDPAEGMGLKLKKVLKKVTKPLVQVAKVVTTPIRAVASSVVSIVDPKLAHEITPEISKKDFENIGDVGKGVAVVTAGVLAAPVIAGAATAGGAASTAATVAAKSMVGKMVLERVVGGLLAPKYEELTEEQQQAMTQEEYDALVRKQEAIAAKQSEAAAKIPEVPPVAQVTPVAPTTPALVTPAIPALVTPPQPEVAINPFLFMSEEQLAAEKRAVEDAILFRQSRGLSAYGEYKDLTLLQLYAKRAMIMAAYTPILIKKYGLYAAGGFGVILAASMLRNKRRK